MDRRPSCLERVRRTLIKRTLILVCIVFAVIWGGVATYLWFWHAGVHHLPLVNPLGLFLCLAVVSSITGLSLAVRWLRWHFLTRRMGIRLATKMSARIYLSTLPGLVTPFYVGELARAFLVGRVQKGATWPVAVIWFIERFSDAAAVGSVLLLSLGHVYSALVVAALWLGLMSLSFLPFRSRMGDDLSRFLVALITAGLSAVAWVLPVAALWFAANYLGIHAPFGMSAKAFASGTLVGGATGVPLGTGVTGVHTIDALVAAGASPGAAAMVAVIFRLGTAWFALGVGVLAFLRSRTHLASLLRSHGAGDHFDEISDVYREQIPSHMRDRLLHKKSAPMLEWLDAAGFRPGACGLDVGCGQAWYLCEMARTGYEMCGVDTSPGQIREARDHCILNDVSADLLVADARALPLEDCSLDFAYAINVLHHLDNRTDQLAVIEEILRVLKPGGVFFLHEMNVGNPLFRLYLDYLYPLLVEIDEGTETWIRPSCLPQVRGASWSGKVAYLTFLPDFTPLWLAKVLAGLESRLERSRLRSLSAHYMATLVKD